MEVENILNHLSEPHIIPTNFTQEAIQSGFQVHIQACFQAAIQALFQVAIQELFQNLTFKH